MAARTTPADAPTGWPNMLTMRITAKARKRRPMTTKSRPLQANRSF
jgi:hypothetical protein